MEPIAPPVPETDVYDPPMAPVSEPDTALIDLNSLGAIPPHLADRVTIQLPPAWVIEREPTENAGKTEGTNAILLWDRQHHAELREVYEHLVYRLDTKRAVLEASQWQLEFDPRTERVIIHSVAVTRGDRRAENARIERLRVLQRERGLEYQMVDGSLTVIILLEDVRVGDVLDVAYTRRLFPEIFANHYWGLFQAPASKSFSKLYVRLCFDRARPMRWKSNDSKLAPTLTETPEKIEWTWELDSASPGEAEQNVPGWHFVSRWIQFSDFQSWSEIIDGFLAAWPQDLTYPELVELAKSIAVECDSELARAERVLTLVQDDIRYLSVNTEFGGRIPTPGGVVLKRGYGDCKDKAMAAALLLRLLGIPARPVLVHGKYWQSIEAFLPTPAAFNHAIVEYELNHRRRWVDATNAHQGGAALTRPGAPFRLGLPLGPGVTGLEPIAVDEAGDRYDVHETLHLNTRANAANLSVVITATGRYADHFRHQLIHEGKEAFAEQREAYYRAIYHGLRRIGTVEWRDDREANELAFAETFELFDLMTPVSANQRLQFRFPAHIIQSALAFHDTKNRRHPWALRSPCRIKQTIEIDSSGLPQNLTRSSQVMAKAFRFSCSSQQRPGLASVTYVLQFTSDHVPPEDFEAHKTKVREVLAFTRVVGEVPAGSVTPWKRRGAETLLPRHIRRSIPAKPADDAGALARELGEPAPPLPSTENRGTAATVAPRPDGASRLGPTPGARGRVEIQRPNPVVLDHAPVGRRRDRHATRRKRERDRMIKRIAFWAVVAIGAAVLAVMYHVVRRSQ